MGIYIDERAVIAAVLDDGWTACRVAWPDQDFTVPSPTNDKASPASYIAVEIDYDEIRQVDFAGGAQINGRVEHRIWVERCAGDYLVRSYMDTLRGLYAAASSTSITFLEPTVGAAVIEGEWYGRAYSVPFVRFG